MISPDENRLGKEIPNRILPKPYALHKVLPIYDEVNSFVRKFQSKNK